MEGAEHAMQHDEQQMDCCAVSDAEVHAPKQTCPRCGVRGRRVKPITLSSLLKPGASLPEDAWRFCQTPACTAVYFGESSKAILEAAQLSVRVGLKESRSDRPICYCFGFTAADIEAAARHPVTVFQQVTEHCRRGEDRCKQTNPQGICCLGNIRAIERTALEK